MTRMRTNYFDPGPAELYVINQRIPAREDCHARSRCYISERDLSIVDPSWMRGTSGGIVVERAITRYIFVKRASLILENGKSQRRSPHRLVNGIHGRFIAIGIITSEGKVTGYEP